jgi:RNA polymerase sigma-70 factor (ECF subfamily)
MTQLSMEARTLIERVGLADGPSAERRVRVKRRLVAALVSTGAGIGGVTSAAAASAHAGAAGVALGTATGKGALTLGSVAIWLAAGAGLGTLVSTPALVSRLTAAQKPLAAAASPAVARPVGPAAPPAASALGAGAVAEAPQLEQPANERVARSPALEPASPAPVSTLADETRLLETAQRELAASRPARALALLDEYEQRFPKGTLGEEAGAARVLSLCALGRVGEAKRIAQAFLAASPRSPLLPRLRGSCALADGTDSAYTRK